MSGKTFVFVSGEDHRSQDKRVQRARRISEQCAVVSRKNPATGPEEIVAFSEAASPNEIYGRLHPDAIGPVDVMIFCDPWPCAIGQAEEVARTHPEVKVAILWDRPRTHSLNGVTYFDLNEDADRLADAFLSL